MCKYNAISYMTPEHSWILAFKGSSGTNPLWVPGGDWL
jgi:hypothetical protein